MKKLFKIIGFTILALFLLLLGAAFILPTVFKDDIENAIKEEAGNQLNGSIYFDADDLNITLFSHFPSLSVEMKDFGIIGNEEYKTIFKQDTLIAVGSFELAINLKSLFEDKMVIDGIYLDKLKLNAIVTKEGNENYMVIMKASEETPEAEEEETTEESTFAMKINEWNISDAHIIYDDQLGNMFAEVKGLNHSGNGDMTLEVYDLATKTNIKALTYKMDGVSYLHEGEFDADMTMNIDLKNMKFTFKENQFKLNDFGFNFEGWVALPEDADVDLDISFGSNDTEFKSILSLVPGVFLEGFEEIKTSGTLAFNGKVKGKMVGDQLPTYDIKLLVKDGFFQYPDLPTAVENINMDMQILNTDGILANNIIDIKAFHLDMGKNPVDAKVWVKGIDEMDLDANIKANVDLGSLNSIYPIEDIELKGIYSLDASAKGIFNDSLEKYPIVDAIMSLKNGFVKSSEVPAPLENIQLASKIHVPVNMNDAHVSVDNFSVTLSEETFNAKGEFFNLDNPTYDLSMNGTLNFDKLLKLFPLDDMTLQGKVIIHDFTTKGDMATIDAEQYQNLPTSGSISIEKLYYEDADLPQGFKINSAKGAFNPDKMELSSFDGAFGKSDMQMSGVFSNYMGYLFSTTDTVLQGNLNFAATLMDLNDMMGVEETTPTEVSEEETEVSSDLEVIEVPKNINFVLHTSNIKKVLYDNYVIENLNGDIIVKDGIVSMKKVGFNMLGGSFVTNGSYSTEDIKNPNFYWDIDIKGLGIKESYQTFATVKALAPAAKKMEGKFDGSLKLFGDLKPDMMPEMSSLRGEGLFKVFNAALKGHKTMDKVQQLTGFKGFNDIKIADNTQMAFSILKGMVDLKPFKAKAGDADMQMGGTNSFDGTMNYIMGIDVPSKAMGQATSTLTNSLGVGGTPVGDKVHMDIGLAGKYDELKPKLLGTKASGTSELKADAKNAAKAAVDQKKTETKQAITTEVNKQKAEVKNEVKKETEAATKKVESQVKDETKNQINNLKGGLKGFKK